MSVKIKTGGFADLDASKFFGEILLPEKWLKDGIFGETEIFFCQINLEDFSSYDVGNLLPHEGMLYFFLDLEKVPAEGIVRYFDGLPEAYTDFNEEADAGYDVETELPIVFEQGADEKTAMLCHDEKVFDNEVCLLRFCPREFEELDFLSDIDGNVYFVIDKDSLKKCDFTAVKLVVG